MNSIQERDDQFNDLICCDQQLCQEACCPSASFVGWSDQPPCDFCCEGPQCHQAEHNLTRLIKHHAEGVNDAQAGSFSCCSSEGCVEDRMVIEDHCDECGIESERYVQGQGKESRSPLSIPPNLTSNLDGEGQLEELMLGLDERSIQEIVRLVSSCLLA